MGCKSQNSDLCILYPTSYNVYKCALTTHLQHREYRLFCLPYNTKTSTIQLQNRMAMARLRLINCPTYGFFFVIQNHPVTCYICLRDTQKLYIIFLKRTMVVKHKDLKGPIKYYSLVLSDLGH